MSIILWLVLLFTLFLQYLLSHPHYIDYRTTIIIVPCALILMQQYLCGDHNIQVFTNLYWYILEYIQLTLNDGYP